MLIQENQFISYPSFRIFLLGWVLMFNLYLSFSQAIENEPSLKNKKIIYIYGGCGCHSPKESVDLFVPLLEKEGAIVQVHDNFKILENSKVMTETDLIIQVYTDAFTPAENRMNDEQFRALQIAMLNGTGLSGWHGGLGDSNRVNTRYQFVVGGQFVAHPGNITDFEVLITNKSDYITKGINDFQIKNTEQYYMMIDPNIKVLAVSEFKKETYQKSDTLALEQMKWINIDVENQIKGSVMPMIWKKNYGKGRIFYCSIGHNLYDFDTPELMTMQMRGFRWASEGKYANKEPTITPVYKK